MNEFKIGDWIECVDIGGSEQLISGYYYRVCDVENPSGRIRLINNKGNCYWYNSRFFKLLPSPEQHVKEFLKRLEYVLVNDNTLYGHISNNGYHLELDTQVCDIIGVEDIYTYINNSYDQLTSQAAQKRKQSLLDKKAKLDVELAEINKELEGL